jgi:hypothetical protein
MDDELDSEKVTKESEKLAAEGFFSEPATDRKRGLFTESDRQFLLGNKEYEHQQSSINKRRDIRNRIHHTFLDFQFLRYLSESERDKLFSEIESRELHHSVSDLIAFIYGGTDGNIQAIEEMVKSGLSKAEIGGLDGYQGGARNVGVDIELIFEHEVEEIYKRFKQTGGRDLTPAEIGVLVREGRLNPDDYEQLAWDEEERPLNVAADRVSWWYHEKQDGER